MIICDFCWGSQIIFSCATILANLDSKLAGDEGNDEDFQSANIHNLKRGIINFSIIFVKTAQGGL